MTFRVPLVFRERRVHKVNKEFKVFRAFKEFKAHRVHKVSKVSAELNLQLRIPYLQILKSMTSGGILSPVH